MSILSKFLKKNLKGSKEYQEGRKKAKQAKVDKLAKQRDEAKSKGKYAKQARKQNKINKKLDKKADTLSGKHKGKDLKAKAEKDASWKKASKSQKGKTSMSDLIKARNAAKKSGDKTAYAAAQNQINKAYGSKKVHKVSDEDKKKSSALLKAKNEAAMKKNEADKKAKSKKDSKQKSKLDVTDAVKNIAIANAKKPKPDVRDKVKSIAAENAKKKELAAKKKKGDYDNPPFIKEDGGMVESYGHGGKVDGGGMFNWPSRDARNGGKK